jgi:hypothetical protein
MTRTQIERQLAALEREVARIAPPESDADNPLAWAAWLTKDELEFAEEVARLSVSGDELTPAEYARWIEVQAGGIRRMLNGEPTDVEKSRAAMDQHVTAELARQAELGRRNVVLGMPPR